MHVIITQGIPVISRVNIARPHWRYLVRGCVSPNRGALMLLLILSLIPSSRNESVSSYMLVDGAWRNSSYMCHIMVVMLLGY